MPVTSSLGLPPSGRHQDTSHIKRIVESNPLLESFGNAQTAAASFGLLKGGIQMDSHQLVLLQFFGHVLHNVLGVEIPAACHATQTSRNCLLWHSGA